MPVVDSNIVIYATRVDQPALRDLVMRLEPAVSAISRVEVLGFHRITPAEDSALADFFLKAEVIDVSTAVIDAAIALRRQRRMSLGDAIVAATALGYDATLITRNTADFRWIPGLTIINPFDASPPAAP